MPTPLVSICLPNLNTRKFLPPRMDTLLAQTNADWEMVVFDNYSDDGSWEYFQEFKGDPRIRLHQAERQGMYANWNNCLREARGKYIHIATSDDLEAPDFQEKLLNLLESNADCALAYCRHQDIDVEGRTMPEHPPEKREFRQPLPPGPVRRSSAAEAFHAFALWAPWFTLNALIFRRDLLDKTGLVPTHLGRHGDTAWGWHAALCSDTLFHPEVLASWRRHPQQATNTALANAKIGLEMRQLVEATREFVAQHGELIPPHWRAVPGWLDRLLAFRLKEIRQYGGLTRQGLRQKPLAFLQTALWSNLHDRSFLVSQITSGLGYPPEIMDQDFPSQFFLLEAARDFALPAQQPLPIEPAPQPVTR